MNGKDQCPLLATLGFQRQAYCIKILPREAMTQYVQNEKMAEVGVSTFRSAPYPAPASLASPNRFTSTQTFEMFPQA